MSDLFCLSQTPITILLYKNWEGIPHGFFGKLGGVSQGIYSSLNGSLSGNDSHAAVKENQYRALKTIGCEKSVVFFPTQKHTSNVLKITDPKNIEILKIPADGLATCLKGITLGITTADCAPVLFYDNKNQIIGAAHAGWRGAKSGVLEKTVHAMKELGAQTETITAIIGPTIAQKNYEVDSEFYANFIKNTPENICFFCNAPKAGHFLFDLTGYIIKRLVALSIETHASYHDTFTGPFFSRRNALAQSAQHYGCSMSLIMLSF